MKHKKAPHRITEAAKRDRANNGHTLITKIGTKKEENSGKYGPRAPGALGGIFGTFPKNQKKRQKSGGRPAGRTGPRARDQWPGPIGGPLDRAHGGTNGQGPWGDHWTVSRARDHWTGAQGPGPLDQGPGPRDQGPGPVTTGPGPMAGDQGTRVQARAQVILY